MRLDLSVLSRRLEPDPDESHRNRPADQREGGFHAIVRACVCACERAADRSDRVSVCLSTSTNYRVRLSTGHFARNCDFPRARRAPARYWLQSHSPKHTAQCAPSPPADTPDTELLLSASLPVTHFNLRLSF